MKITVFLIAILCLNSSAATYAQNITLSEKNVSMEKVIGQIKKQSNFLFWYESKLLKQASIESINLQNGTIKQALDLLVKDQPFVYSIVDNTVVINEKQAISKPIQLLLTITGKVTDDKGIPLPGVSVLIKGTQKGTVTDKNGAYSLAVEKDQVIVFSFIGFKRKEITVGDQQEISVSLELGQSQLNDVVVIGYGNQSREKLTSAISKVKSADLNRYSGASFAQQIAGKAAGVVINDASAQPGTDPQIVIRGIGTLTAGRSPLVVVDGFPLSEGSSFNSINPQDIESIDVLKDAAAGAIYGSRAANGVILITTKKGSSDKVKVSFDAYTGFQERNDNLKYVDAYQAAIYFTEARDNAYISKDPANRSITDDRATRVAKGASLRELRLNYLQPYLNNQPGLTNTNWLNEVFRKAPMSSYNFSVSGGSGKTNYYVSANYFKQDGIVINNGLERFSGTVKLESKLSKMFTYGVSVNPSYSKDRYFNNNSNNSNDIVSDITINYPFFTTYNADGSPTISQQIKANTPEDGALAESPVALAKLIKNNRNDFRTFGNTYLTFEPVTGLKFKTLAGADVRTNFYDYYNPSTVGAYRQAAPKPAVAVENDGNIYNYISENTVNYNKSIGNHTLDVLAGYTFQSETGSATSITGSGIPDDNIANIGGASAFAVTADRYKWTQISYLARIQYSYLDKYLLSGTLRRDGSSRFGDNNKWGNFPSVTAGYVLSKESFFPENNVVTFAKLRASWGSAGNNQIGSYSSKALVGSTSSNGGVNEYNYNYVFGSTLSPGFAATTTANNNLTWETKTSTDLGVDLGLFQNISLAVDYYNATTKNLLLNVPIPEQSGFVSAIQNIGKVNNKGFELELTGNNFTAGAVKLGFNANIATNVNKVLALAPGQTQIIQGAESNFVTKVGGPVAEMYGYNITGVYKNQAAINNTPHLAGTLVGDYIVEDVNHDGIIDSRDQKAFGTYNPKFSYGFGGNVNYKRFELNFSFNGVYGRKIFDRGLATLDDSGEGFAMPSQYYFDNRYDPVANPNGFYAAPNLGNLSSARRLTRASSIFYYDGSYLRLRNLQIAYNLPDAWTSKIRISHIRLYTTANNLFTWTKYRGYNPDATSSSVLTDGLANTNYPVARSFIFGANVTF
ncbi:SusC/RagA family TonB-linked outer membrane protein [Mucilaginibacter flavus]|uniref:SusC/RagA family TonB-linked outer membrane protein n=1 Tax=Mucilaginibacter flavus TaxID=931504 RepID=UPI0025B4F777|nr:TonB-dependent receptor [Mucilaginibacter flavus]MDN3581391.1 TonB-dependent receptor [Mucilaginibacter flavus]